MRLHLIPFARSKSFAFRRTALAGYSFPERGNYARVSKELSPAKVAQYLKGASWRKLQDEFPHLKKRYWGQHIWARGYFCASVGVVSQAQIQEYIDKHRQEP